MVVELQEPGRPPRSPRRDAAQDEVTAMLCPSCNVALHLSVRQNVEIDYCPNCRGVWLDRGELNKIIERSAEAIAPRAQRFVEEDSDDRPRKRSSKKSKFKKKDRLKDWLEDLFD